MSELILITGGSASGKSNHAEQILCAKAKSRLYLATMYPHGQEAKSRIDRHQQMRRGKGFDTIEKTDTLDAIVFTKKYDGILLEDLGNYLANERYFVHDATQPPVVRIQKGIQHLQNHCGSLVIVGNEIFADGARYDDETLAYLNDLGQLHQWIAQQATTVLESVCGILVCHKGDASAFQTAL